jgi:hypothetical protein
MCTAFVHYCLSFLYELCTAATIHTQVLEDSSQIALGRYKKTPFKPDGWRFIMNRSQPNNSNNNSSSSSNSSSSKEEEARLAALWEWRDAVAREVC